MPPPAASPHQSPPNTLGHPLSRGTLRSPQTYGTLRDAMATMPPNRSANMSLSSIMGADSPITSRPPAWSPPTSSTTRPPSHHGRQPPSPQGPSYGPIVNDSRSNDTRPVSSSIPQYGPVNETYQSKPGGSGAQTVPLGSPKLSPTDPLRSQRDALIPSRPLSQPGLEIPPRLRRATDLREDSSPVQSRDGLTNGQRVNGDGRHAFTFSESQGRERSTSDQGRPAYAPYQPSNPQTLYGPPPRPASPTQRDRREDGPLQYGRWSPRQSLDIPQPDRPIASREGPQLPPDQLEGPIYGPFLPQDPRNAPSYGPYGRQAPSFGEANAHMEPGQNSSSEKYSRPFLDSRLRKSLEDSQMSHRSILASSQEAHHRVERSSPLPQAVQGASSQPAGSGRDPTVKSEFGRMFSGLGSGVGSTPVPNGSPTPVRASYNLEGDRRTSHLDGMYERPSRSPGAERLKRAYEANERIDLESLDGRITPGYNAPRSKRTKQNHSTPHHHHHPLGHQ